MVQILSQYIQRMESRLIRLKKLQVRLGEIQSIVQADGNEHLDNPINGFLLVMRATTEWSVIESLINEKINETIPNILDGLMSEDEELSDPESIRSGAIEAILRIQSV